MTNNKKFYCNHCKKNTLFFLDSDMKWYCGECEMALNSLDGSTCDIFEFMDEELEYEEEFEQIFRCPHCKTIISEASVLDGYLCPVCLEDVSEQVGLLEYDVDEDW